MSLRIKPNDNIAIKVVKGFTRVPLVILTFGISESYYAIDRRMAAMVGNLEGEVIASWGVPTHSIENADGTKLFIYEEQKSLTTSGSYNSYYYAGHLSSSYSPPQTVNWVARRTFIIGRSGRVTGYTWKGL